MTSAQKVASSLLVSVLAFSIFTVAAFSGLFDFVEVKFYQPAVKQLKEQKLDEIKDAENEYLESLMSRFNIFEMEKDVKTYADLRPDDISVQNREKLRATLMTETAALLGIRLVDDNGSNVYFSTFDSDKIKSAKGSVSYKNYGSLNDFPFELVKSSDWIPENAPSGDKGRVIKDSRLNRLIFSFPFYDSKNSFRGTLLFYCDANHFNRYLFSRNLIDMNGFCVLVAAENGDQKFDAGFGGYVFGLPNFGRKSAEQQILSEWKQNSEKSFWKMAFEENESAENLSNSQKIEESQNLEKSAENFVDKAEKFLNFKDSDKNSAPKSYFVFSKKLERSDAGFVAAIYDENELKFPKFLRLLLLVSAFITFYLVVFLIFSFKHDDIVVIKSKIASFKKQFIRQYKKMAGIESDSDLENHKKNLEESIKKSLGRLAVKYEPEFQNLFEKCWNEILLEIEKPYAMIPNDSVVVNKNELREILEDIVSSGKLKVSVAEIQKKPAPAIESAQKTPQPNENAVQKNDSDKSDVEENVKSAETEKTESAENAGKETNENIAENEKSSETVKLAEKFVSSENQNAENEEIESLEVLDDEIEEIEPVDENENSAEREDSDNIEELEILDEENDDVGDLELADDEVEELESLDDDENPDEIENAEELEPLEKGENETNSKIAENSNNDDVEELQSLEPVDDAEDLEEIESLKNNEMSEKVVENENSDKNDDVEDLEPIDDIEELSSLGDEEKFDEQAETESASKLEKIAESPNATTVSNEEKTDESPNATLTLIKEKFDEQSETTANSIKENPASPSNEKSDFDDVYKDEPFLEKIDFGVSEAKNSFEDNKTENDIIDNFSTENLDYAFLDEEPAESFGKFQEKENPQNPENPNSDDFSNQEKSFENSVFALETSHNSELSQKTETSTDEVSQSSENQKMQTDADSSLEIASENSEIEFVKNPENFSNVNSDSENQQNPENPNSDDFSNQEKVFENSDFASESPRNSELSQKNEATSDEVSQSSQNPETQIKTDSVQENVSENLAEKFENFEKNPEISAEFSKIYEEKKSDSDNIIAAGKDVHSEKEFEQVSEEELPELESERSEPAEAQNQNDTEEISALEELESPEETMPFSFIQIAANDTNLTELRAEVSDTIVQNSDGTFRIADKSAYYSNKEIDMNFKKLVDSVLKN